MCCIFVINVVTRCICLLLQWTVQQESQPASCAGVRRRLITADGDQVEGEDVVRVVRERVHSGKRWMKFAVTTDDVFSDTQN